MPTSAELAFLHEQRIPESDVFHAEGMPKKLYKPVMEELGAIFVTGSAPCLAAGHTIRTRAGHCAQCDTSRIAYQRRHRSKGFVYVAHSRSLDLVKIGSSKDPLRRVNGLAKMGYGGCADWHLVRHYPSSSVGRVEFNAHAQLESERVPVVYLRDGFRVCCREAFRVRPSDALRAVERALQEQ
jgi:hypothetical protein